MARIIAGCLAWFGFGVIIAETLNSSGLLDFKLNAILAAGSMSSLYLLSQILGRHFENQASRSAKDKEKYRIFSSTYLFILWTIGLCCLLGIPFLWWGVIKKLAVSANEGVRAF